MLLNISGLSSQLGLRLTDDTQARQLEQLRQQPENQRAMAAFQEEIGSITSPKELVDNYQVYSFVMRAFDLEDQIFGRGMMRKVLESDPSDETALVNRLTDPRFRELHDALGFTATGASKPDFNDPAWQQGIVDRYYDQAFVNNTDEQNPTVGTVLKLRRDAPELNNWFEVMKDPDLSEFFRTTLGLPTEMAVIDLDRQKDIFESKFDLRTINDPEVQEEMINRYLALSDIQNPNTSVSNPVLSVLQGSSGLGVIISLSVPQVSFSASSLYR